MHRGFYHPPVVRRGAHPVRSYGDAGVGADASRADRRLTDGPASGFYPDTGGYAWYYDAATQNLTMVASPNTTQRLVFGPSHPRWQKMYDAVIAGKSPVSESSVLQSARLSGGKTTSGGSSGGGAPRGGTKAPEDAKLPDSKAGSITDAVWFWPVAILVPTAAVVGGLLLWPKKGK